jgi:putative acetyltransferase
MLVNRQSKTSDIPLILSIWEDSVRATHVFLTEEDIAFFKGKIPNYLEKISLLIWLDGEKIVGFSGCSNNHLDMLFLDSKAIGKNYGSQILSWLIENRGINEIDVNKQNTQAKNFYLKHGFEIISESATDGFSKPYPILHLRKK